MRGASCSRCSTSGKNEKNAGKPPIYPAGGRAIGAEWPGVAPHRCDRRRNVVMTSPRFPSTKIAAVVSDVDGTLMTDDKRLTLRAQAIVAKLHARGIIFTIISGRPPRGLRMLLEPVEITTPIGCFNGAVIARPDLSRDHSPCSAVRGPRGRDLSDSRQQITQNGCGAMTFSATTDSQTFDTAKMLAQNVAAWLCALTEAGGGRFSVCLSGGSTPRALYEQIATPVIAMRFPWSHVHWFWGDERFVPHNDPDSNYRMARDAFLSRVPIPLPNIHPIPTEGLSAEEAAAAYEAALKTFYGADVLAPDRPLFDVTLLGIGENGHTASLFPGQPALQEKRRWAVATIGAGARPRITLTYPVLDSGRDVAFLATGAEKRDVVARARAGDRALPAAMVCPIGRLHRFTDHAASPGGT
jgi:6-phosphogluconolactonase